ncbi:MAG: hypothetical protein IJT42_09775 [Treponema sp.]|nr:hypothetical protein [Treponema sp.]
MKRNTFFEYKRIIRLFGIFGLFSTLLFTSCDGIQTDEIDENTESSSLNYTVSFALANLVGESSEEVERTIYPDQINVDGLSFWLKGTPVKKTGTDDEGEPIWVEESGDNKRSTDDASKELLTGIKYPVKEELDKASFNLDAGAWQFELKAYDNVEYRKKENGEYTYPKEEAYEEEYLRFESITIVPEIKVGKNTIKFNMKLAEGIPSAFKKGSIDIILDCYLGKNTCSEISKVTASLIGISDPSFNATDDCNGETFTETTYVFDNKTDTEEETCVNNFTFTNNLAKDADNEEYRRITYKTNKIPKGIYDLSFDITLKYGDEESNVTVTTYTSVVYVETGSISSLNKKLDKFKQRYTIKYKTVEVSYDEESQENVYSVNDFPPEYFKKAVVSEYNPSSKKPVELPTISSMKRSDKVFLNWSESFDENSHTFGKQISTFTPNDTTLEEKVFYAQWRDLDIYVSEFATSTGNGSKASPYKTLNEAINFIGKEEHQNESLEWTIYIMGSVTAGTEIKSSGDAAISARKITITGYNTKGKSDNWVGADGLVTSTDEKAVVDVNTNFPVEFSYLTIKHNYNTGTGKLATGNGLVFGTSDMNTDIKVDNVKVFDNVVSQTGGAGISNFMNLTLTNCEISGNYAKEMANNGGAGGGIYSHKILSLENCLIKSNSASKGGGIYNSNMLELKNCEFISNSVSSGTGGALHTENSVTISGCKFESNIAGTQGGAIYSTVTGSEALLPDGGVKVKITGTSFTSNTATSTGGGAIAVYNEGSNSLEIILNSGVVIGGENAGNSSNQGGGIYIQGYSNNTSLIIPEDAAGVEVSYNTASQGAGIYVSCSELNINNGSISYNTASESGGGVYLMDSTAVIKGTVSGNEALNGAGVYCDNSTFTLTGTLDFNEASGNGGGIYINNGFGAENAIYAINDGAVISNNTAENGGGVYCASEYGSIPVFEMQGGSITENKASSGNGGGVYISGYSYESLSSPFIFRMTKGSISGNSASVSGGGVYIDKSAEMFMSGSAVVGKGDASVTATSAGYSNKASNGGGIYNDGKLYLGYDAEITTVESTTTVTPSVSTLGNAVLYNFATSNGGGIYNAGEFYFASGSVGYNATETSGYGGGIYNFGSVYMHGDACVGDSSATKTASLYAKSNSSGRGGGIYNDSDLYLGYSDKDTPVDLTGGIIYNRASNGAGVYNGTAGGSENATIYMASGSVARNSAGQSGAGMCINIGKLYFTGGIIEYNKAVDNGGGIMVNSGSMYMYGNAVIGNPSAVSVADSLSYSNFANEGGGIYNYEGAVYLGMKSNSDDEPLTGGIYYNYSSRSNLEEGSTGGGGGVYNSKNFTMKSGFIKYNGSASEYGKKGVASGEAAITVIDSSLTSGDDPCVQSD